MNNRRAGLTLVEVLLAMVILAAGLGVMVVAAGRCVAVARKSANYATARNLIARVELENPLDREEIASGEDGGDFAGGPEGFRWQRTIEPYADETLPLYRVTIRVTWTERGQGLGEDVTRLVYAPEAEEMQRKP